MFALARLCLFLFGFLSSSSSIGLGHTLRKSLAVASLPLCFLASPNAYAAAVEPSAAEPIATATTAPTPRATASVYLDFSIARKKPERVTAEIYGQSASEASLIFLNVCKGDNVYGDGVVYDGSQVSRIVKDKEITIGKFALGKNNKQETWMDNVGKVRIRSIDLAEKATHRDTNSLTHKRGSISVPKGGGSFEFSIAPTDGANDLNEKNVVIGQVVDGFEVIDKINQIPVSKEDSIGSKGGFSSLGKGFDGRAKLASVNRPLVKVVLAECRVDEKANIASFLTF